MLTEMELRALPRLSSVEARFWPRIDIVDDDDSCWLWRDAESLTPDGYASFSWKDGPFAVRTPGAHRVAFYLTNGFVPEHTCHSCDNPPCCRPSHLFAGTRLINVTDRHRGPDQRGSKNHHSRLTEADVVTIRERAARGETDTALGQVFGVSRATITYIVRGTTWKHAGGPVTEAKQRNRSSTQRRR